MSTHSCKNRSEMNLMKIYRADNKIMFIYLHVAIFFFFSILFSTLSFSFSFVFILLSYWDYGWFLFYLAIYDCYNDDYVHFIFFLYKFTIKKKQLSYAHQNDLQGFNLDNEIDTNAAYLIFIQQIHRLTCITNEQWQ